MLYSDAVSQDARCVVCSFLQDTFSAFQFRSLLLNGRNMIGVHFGNRTDITVAAKENHTPVTTMLSEELLFSEEKQGPQRKYFGGRVFPCFCRAFYLPPAWKALPDASKVFQNIFFQWW